MDIILDSPIGPLGFKIRDNHIYKITFLPVETPEKRDEHCLAMVIKQALNRYFRAESKYLCLPHIQKGTIFQKTVYNALQHISFGQTISYGEIANRVNSHPRAIGQALKRNSLPLIFPCHRVISKHSIGGFVGESTGPLIETKRQLLAWEKDLSEASGSKG